MVKWLKVGNWSNLDDYIPAEIGYYVGCYVGCHAGCHGNLVAMDTSGWKLDKGGWIFPWQN